MAEQEYIQKHSLIVGDKIYVTCDRCKRMIWWNRPFFGSVHVCEPDYSQMTTKQTYEKMKKHIKSIYPSIEGEL